MATQLYVCKPNPLTAPPPRLPARLCSSSLQGLPRDIVTQQRCPFAKMTQACFCKRGTGDGWVSLCSFHALFRGHPSEQRQFFARQRGDVSAAVCVQRTHTQKGHLITPLPTKLGSNPQPSREPSGASSYRCSIKCERGIPITKGRLLLSLFFNCLE